MLAAFTKALNLVTADDIAEVPAQIWPEGYEVEFKETLPHRTGGVHPWLLSDQGSIGDYARDEILAEVVAFANSQGGSVILGIAETTDDPPRARTMVPLPRVGDLQRRFEDQARSCIDPPLPLLQIRAIEMDGQGRGVVVFRTSPSRAAPHRLTTTRESYVRRGSSTVKMTMREIQDMTLNVARGLAGIDAKFKQRHDAFREWSGNQGHAVAYRVTAIPLVDLHDPGRILGKTNVFPIPREFKATVGSRTFELKKMRAHGHQAKRNADEREQTHRFEQHGILREHIQLRSARPSRCNNLTQMLLAPSQFHKAILQWGFADVERQ